MDQDILPDWYKEDPQRYNTEFRQAVKDWWKEHVLIDQKIEELSSGYYRLKRCEVKKLLKDVQVMCDSSAVQEMYSSSTVQEMYSSSTVQRMCDSSIARSYQSDKVKILASPEIEFELVIHKKERHV